ncbi:MAG: hypothetical protein RLZZ324_186 [Candidatus Parcubacteria bacterium]|jgi:hypothetical protein
MLTLHINTQLVGIAGAVPVSWCLDRETAQKLTGQPAFLLLVTAPDGSAQRSVQHELRQVVALTDPLAYVSFARAGLNRVFARLLVGGTLGEWNNRYKATGGNRRYEEAVRDFDGDGHSNTAELAREKLVNCKEDLRSATERLDEHSAASVAEYAERIPPAEIALMVAEHGQAVLPVDVPASSFATAPFWEEPFVNWLFKHQPADQCEYRKRRFLAYPLGIIVLLFKYAFSLLFGIVRISLLPRRIETNHVLHPLTYDFVWPANIEGGYFWTEKPGDSPMLARFPLILLTPLYLGLIAGVMTLSHAFQGHAWYVRFALTYASSIGIILCVIVAILVVIAVMNIRTADLSDAYEAIRVRLGRPSSASQAAITDSDLELLVCESRQHVPSFAMVPRERRTLKLRFLDIKSKVCMPFSR